MNTNFAGTDIRIEDFNYDLPDERIAKYPIGQRDHSKLLVYRNKHIEDDVFMNLEKYLPDKSLLVMNNTKVIRARLFFHKESGALIEIFVLDPIAPSDYAMNFQQKERCNWKCIVGNLKKWKQGTLSMKLTIGTKIVTFSADNIAEVDNARNIQFSWDDSSFTFSEILEAAGNIPIPPYLNREAESSDLVSYQTVYSKIKGSVAAPTAGLHFTTDVLNELAKQGFETAEVTLHVGAGTFQPVKSETIGGHPMHNEHIVVDRGVIEKLALCKSPIIAVGTTSVRTLESLYWLGVRLIKHPDTQPQVHQIEQWEPYSDTDELNISREDAMNAVILHLDKYGLPQIKASTRIIIVPGYKFHVINGMFTNFHQPQSTLLLLVSAFIGNAWRDIYAHALDCGYRFLSYGDSNLYLVD